MMNVEKARVTKMFFIRSTFILTTCSILTLLTLWQGKSVERVAAQAESKPEATITALLQTRAAIIATITELAPISAITNSPTVQQQTTPQPTDTPLPLPVLTLDAEPKVEALVNLLVRRESSTNSAPVATILPREQYTIVNQTDGCNRLQIRLYGRSYGWITNSPTWTLLNYSCEQVTLYTLADQMFVSSDYPNATYFYDSFDQLNKSSSIENQPNDLLFRRMIASALGGGKQMELLIEAYQQRVPTFIIDHVDGKVDIPSNHFKLMSPINPPTTTFGIDLSTSRMAGAGVLWWSARTSALIYIENSGTYQLNYTLLNASPGPINMRLGIDGEKGTDISLTKADNSWEVSSLQRKLAAGFHLIDIWFVNDGLTNGQDRNAFYKSVQLLPK